MKHLRFCLSSIILSPLNGNVKMSPYETGDIHVASRVTNSCCYCTKHLRFSARKEVSFRLGDYTGVRSRFTVSGTVFDSGDMLIQWWRF